MRARKVVLVADDEVSLRYLIRTSLATEGYEVLEAADGNEAWGVSLSHQGTIDLLVMDVAMPHMNGVSAYQQISAERSGIKVIFISGGVPEGIKLPAGSSFLAKPFCTLDALKTKVREVLEISHSPTPAT